MEAKIEKKGEIYIVHLSGRIDYESADVFRKTCLDHLSKEKVIFSLRNLSFVGSSGITPFVETMTTLSFRTEGGLKFSSVGTEFRRVFESSAMRNIEIYEDTESARCSYESYPMNYNTNIYVNESKAPEYISSEINFVNSSEENINDAAAVSTNTTVQKDIDNSNS